MLGYVPEESHLYSYLTGPEYLRLVGRLRRIPDAILDDKIDRFMQLLGIYDDRYQTLSSYSKGMRQKVLIAAAVLHNPRILIVDEPFSRLDVSATRLLKAFVRGLADEGKLVVLCRTFFAQFFTSEAVTSDMRLRQAIVGVLAFLLMPGVMMMTPPI